MAEANKALRTPNRIPVVVLGTAGLIAFGLALIASIINLWPTIERVTTPTAAGHAAPVRLFFALVTVRATPNTALLLLVVVVGALGSLIHTATSFADFVGNRRFYASWSAWYLLRPVIGASLAALLYFAVRGGFFSGSAPSTNVNPYGMAALAGLTGLFSKQATDKLREVFETLFRVSGKEGDAQRKDDLANAVPVLTAIEPASVHAGATNVTLTVRGQHFAANATTIRLGEANPSVKVTSSTELTVDVPDSALAAAGTLDVTAITAPPGGGESDVLQLEVSP